MTVKSILDDYSSDIQGVETFCTDKYNEIFGSHFSELQELYKRMRSKVRPISDAELEYILVELPMELFATSEKLNTLRLDYEVIKLKNKQELESLRSNFIIEAQDMDISKSEKAEFVSRSTNLAMVEYELVASAYDSLITRVTNEQSFAKELIMGAKKVWDSRRSAEASNPVNPVNTELPDYDAAAHKTYVK